MTTSTAALVLAWAAIVLLTLATAGLMRRMDALSASNTPQLGPAGSTIGLQLPVSQYLKQPVPDRRRAGLLLLFVSPSCRVCQSAIDELGRANRGRYDVVVASKEGSFEPLMLPAEFGQAASAQGLFRVMGVPATPYLARLDHDGTISDTTLLTSTSDLSRWLPHDPAEMQGAGS